jgi:hypothetical protein
MRLRRSTVFGTLAAVEAYLARLTEHVTRVEGERDRLLLALADLEGAHDQRPVAVR